MSEEKLALGEPVEIQWWVVALSLLPFCLGIAGVVISQPLWRRTVAIVPSIALIYVIVRVSLRVKSQNMQSVWISLAFGIWAVFPIAYVAAAISR